MKKGSFRHLLSPFGIVQLIMVAAVGAALWLAYPPWRWERMKEDIRKRYPGVPQIDSAALADWFSRRSAQQPVIIDVRPQAEYDFSHLPGARHLRPSDTPAVFGFSEKDDVPFLVYDSTGSDSTAVASAFMKLGYKRVQSLEGGIFEWANLGHPLEGPNGPAGKVDPGASPHAGLLKRSRRAQ
jgi:rhodanese-related sulfurtransferase